MTQALERTSRTVLRREPKQERSRDRIDEILKVAMTLIGRKGIDAVTMKEIAALSGGPIASVYQYFPNKSAIIATLYERYSEEVRGLIANCVLSINTVDDVFASAAEIFQQYYQSGRENPAIQDLINAIQADKALQDMDVAETRYQADIFYRETYRFIPETAREAYSRTVFLMFHLAAGTVRLALMVPQGEAGDIVADFKSIVDGQLSFFMNGAIKVA
jgi:AcrR family transcriptional regulator